MDKPVTLFGNDIQYSAFLKDDPGILNDCVEKMARELVETIQRTGRNPVRGLDIRNLDSEVDAVGCVVAKLHGEARNDPNGLMFALFTACAEALRHNETLAISNERMRAILANNGLSEHPDED